MEQKGRGLKEHLPLLQRGPQQHPGGGSLAIVAPTAIVLPALPREGRELGLCSFMEAAPGEERAEGTLSLARCQGDQGLGNVNDSLWDYGCSAFLSTVPVSRKPLSASRAL